MLTYAACYSAPAALQVVDLDSGSSEAYYAHPGVLLVVTHTHTHTHIKTHSHLDSGSPESYYAHPGSKASKASQTMVLKRIT